MRIDQVPDPIIEAPTDVVARITHAGICGSDLWSYRGIDHRAPGDRMGHEWIGMVEEVGAEVRTIKKGDRVISPFLISDGTCEFCRAGSTVAVIGDGAVGLCGVVAAKRLGAERIFMIGHQEQRLKLAQAFGATDIITARDEQAVQEVREHTHGGAEVVLECVGTLEAMNMAIHMTRPGKSVSCVGFTHADQPPDLTYRLFQNITITGGVAPARAYLPELLQDVIAGKLDPSPVLDMTVDLDGVPAGYAAMDTREAIKVMVLP